MNNIKKAYEHLLNNLCYGTNLYYEIDQAYNDLINENNIGIDKHKEIIVCYCNIFLPYKEAQKIISTI